MKYFLIFSFWGLTFFTSCKTTSISKKESETEKEKKAMDSWLGFQKSALILSWGPPTRTESDGNGGTILISKKIYTLVKNLELFVTTDTVE